MFVDDPGRSKTFYEGVFDASPVYEDESAVAFQFENLIVNLLAAPAARELIDPAAVASAEPGSRLQLTIWVDDVDAVCAELAGRGVTLLNGPIDRPGVVQQPARGPTLLDDWRLEYNHHRPHQSFNYQTPAAYARQWHADHDRRPSQQLRSGPRFLVLVGENQA